MMNPAEQPQLTTAQRAVESPTLWLSLVLGSVLIHLVLFILASIASTQTAKVQLNPEPIAVEFVDPTVARSTASDRAIAVRPGNPSSMPPYGTQVQRPNAPQQPPSLNQPVEQPVENPAEQPIKPLQPVKPQPVKRTRVAVQPRSPQPVPTQKPVSPQPQPSGIPSQPQPAPSSNAPQGGVPGAPSDNGAAQPTPQPLATSTTKILEPSQRRNVLVDIVNSYEKRDFHPKKASIKSPISALILDSPSIAHALEQGIAMKVSLDIAENGFSRVIDTLPGSTGNTLDQATLDKLAEQIFTDLQFEPAEYEPNSLTKKPRRSNLIIEARIRLR